MKTWKSLILTSCFGLTSLTASADVARDGYLNQLKDRQECVASGVRHDLNKDRNDDVSSSDRRDVKDAAEKLRERTQQLRDVVQNYDDDTKGERLRVRDAVEDLRDAASDSNVKLSGKTRRCLQDLKKLAGKSRFVPLD